MGVTDVSPVRRGRHVTIRPLHPNDYTPLYDLALFTDAGSRWRLHGDTPTQDKFLQILLENARVTFAIERNVGRDLIGMVQLWMHDPMNRNGHITSFLDPSVRGRGWPLEGVILFVDFVFRVFNLHKLYFESLADEYSQYGSIVGSILQQEGLLRDHTLVFGEWADYHVLALYKDDVPKLTRLLKGVDG
jgi:[ribosomal protein S5]-alanine N-acetyltransferase